MGRLKTVLGLSAKMFTFCRLLIPFSRLLPNLAIFYKYLHDLISNLNTYSGIVNDYLEVQSNKSAHLLPHEYFQVS